MVVSSSSLVFIHTYPLKFQFSQPRYRSSNASSNFAMASSSTSLSLPSSSSTHRWKYDVFLSFRGEDTRQSFTAHLYAALCQKGIITFKDNLLTRGEKISPALLQAIEESRFSIIIFSENYASSSWCLDELTKILERVEERKQTALPVFHNVDPSNVKKQKGSFKEAFVKHEQVYGEEMEKVGKWRKALAEAATISGWDTRNRDESEVIQEIVIRILNERIDVFSSNMDALVGMGSRMENLLSLLCIGSNDVRFIGIWGMAGIGKTTIAKAIYDQINTKFEGCCFLENVREESQRHGLTYLQETLLSEVLGGINTFNRGINFMKARLHSRKVLIILDDVVNLQQLETLVGNHDWFGLGSRIIITTRDKGLLSRVDAMYEVGELAYDEAHKLFCRYAFKHNPITEEYMQLCNHAVCHIKGIPLALTVLGSFLCNKNIDEWKSALDKLKRIPHEDVYTKLKISFDGLDHTQKGIFLDIACFFKGEDRSFVEEILESHDCFPIIDISVLIDKSLITISNSKLCMHDLLQEMGWEIVRQGDVKYPPKGSRLWVHDEVKDVLETNMGTEEVEGIVFDLSKELNISIDAFAKMSNLRLLRFYNFQFHGSSEYSSSKALIPCTLHERRWRKRKWSEHEMSTLDDCRWRKHDIKLDLSGHFKFPSNNLRSFYWHGYSLEFLPPNFHPNKLVELNLCSSRLKQLWEGNKGLEKLKFIKLSHSRHLTKIPDFSGAPNLRILILNGCTSLVEVHPSIGALKQLTFLNLEGCKKLESFSSSIHMQSLQILNLSGCLKLKKFPELQGNMEHLPELSLEGTAIKGLPSSIEYLTGLALLNLKECKSLESLPKSIFMLKSLKTLILSNCTRLKKLPEIQENMESLTQLFLDGTAMREMPSSIGRLNGLVLLNLKNCQKIASLPRSICELTSLRILNLSGCSELKELPEDLGRLQCLAELNVDGSAIREVPASITHLSNLQELSLEGCKGGEFKSWNLFSFLSSPTQGLRLPSFSGLYSLKKLKLRDCNLLEGALPSDLSSLASLKYLDLSKNNFITMPASLSQLPRLHTLKLGYCHNLQSLPELPSSIERLVANDCTSLKTFSYPSIAYTLRKSGHFRFEFSNCFQLVKNEESHTMEAILRGIPLLASLPKFLDPEEVPSNTFSRYDAIIPGSSIPDWFTHQNVGSSVTVKVTRPWYHTKFMGLAFCAVIDVDARPLTRLNVRLGNPGGCYRLKGSKRCATKAEHIWFGYETRATLPFWCDTMEVSFERAWSDSEAGIKVKKCGVRVVYEEDVNDGECSLPYATMLPPGEYESDSSSEDL